MVLSFETAFTVRADKRSLHRVTRHVSTEVTRMLHNNTTDGALVFGRQVKPYQMILVRLGRVEHFTTNRAQFYNVNVIFIYP